MTFASDIQSQLLGADVEAVVIGEFGWGGGYKEEGKEIPADKTGVPLSWAEAYPLLDYDYDEGYGAPECHAIAVYTADQIVSVSQYDGATNFFTIPRHPGNFQPDMPGG